MQIEKLQSYKTSRDGIHWYDCPTRDDIIDKINEIIEYINTGESVCEELLKKGHGDWYGK